jgi:hypothetical protein
LATDDVAKGGDKTDPTLPVYRGSAKLVQKTTYKNRDGTQLTVTHNGDTQGASAVVMVPQATVSISRIESGILPLDAAEAILGKLNRFAWNGEPQVWLSTGVDFESTDGGVQWAMTYEFQKDSDGDWNPTIVYVDKDGKIPSDLVADSGIKVIDWYEEYDYNQQGI